jgi:EmrB/QacA subfamily drug resistance transporter
MNCGANILNNIDDASESKATIAADPENRSNHSNLILGVCCMSVLIFGMDITIVNVALPAIQYDLHATIAGLQWILDAYTLVIASFLMLAGSMSDRYGRRRVFQIGLALFTVASLLCGFARGMGELIAFRALQGLGASMLNPVALSIIANAFQESKSRARAIGVWGAAFGVALALGPLVGGALTQAVGWRSIFWINVPIGCAAVALAARFIPESKALRARAFDPAGQLLVFVGLASLTSAVIEGPRAGWTSWLILGLFASSGLALAIFFLYEPRCKDPLVDLRFFHSVPFSSATILALCTFASFGGFLFLNTLYLEQVRGFSAFRTGLFTLPLAVMIIICAPLSGRLVGVHGTRPSLLAAGTGLLLSSLMLTHLNIGTPVVRLMLAYASFGVGYGMVNPAITDSAVAGMPLSQAGVASAIASTSRQMGAALGIAVAGTVVAAGRARGSDFTQTTHPMWWIMTGCGAVILLLGWVSNTPWAHASTSRVAYLFDNRRDGCLRQNML